MIAAGGSLLGLGSDVAGSIRIPAAFCGVCGLKPSGGRISTAGHEPVFPASVANWLTAGPLARRVEDLVLALSVLLPGQSANYAQIELIGRRLLIPHFMPGYPVDNEIQGARYNAAETLQAVGMQIQQAVRLTFSHLAWEIVAIQQREWSPTLRTELGGGRPVHFITDLLANLLGKGRVPPNVLVLLSSTLAIGRVARLCGFGEMARFEAFPDRSDKWDFLLEENR